MKINPRVIIIWILASLLTPGAIAQQPAEPGFETEREAVAPPAPSDPAEGTDPAAPTAEESDSVTETDGAETEGAATEGAEGPDPDQDEQAPSDAEPADEEAPFDPAVTDADGTVIREGAQTVSVDFPDEEIRTILRIVADLYDLNLVIPDTLTGRASIKLRNVGWRQVFDVVLSPVGFTFVEEDNIIRVISLEALHREPPVTEVIILNYSRAEDLAGTVLPLIDAEAGGRLQTDQRSNALVVTERSTRMRRIRDIVAELDQPTAQVMIESKFIETTDRDLKNLGANWTSLNAYNIQAGPVEHLYRRERHPTSDIQEALDRRDLDNTHQATSRITNAVFSADQFNLVLSALSTQTDTKLVSNPTVVTLNNKDAEILIGERYPIVLPRYNPETGTYEAGSPEFLDLGIALNVTPQVNAAGFISLTVRPKVSSLGGTVSYFGAEYPIEVTREAASTVTIRDGYTVAIGGLVEDAIQKVTTKVPLLGDIPGLGRLFRHDNDVKDQRNLIIFITARTLNPDGTTFEEIVDPRVIRSMGLKREDIPGYRPDIEMFPEDKRREERRAREEERRARREARAAPVVTEGEDPLEQPDAVTPDPEDERFPLGDEPRAEDVLREDELREDDLEDELRIEDDREDELRIEDDEWIEPAPAPEEEPRRPSRWLTPTR